MSIPDDVIEAVARALHEDMSKQDILGYLGAKIDCDRCARAAILAYQTATKPAGDDAGLVARLTDVSDTLEDGRLPVPYDLYRAVKREEDGTGWHYEVVPLGVSDLREALARITALNAEVATLTKQCSAFASSENSMRDDLVLMGLARDAAEAKAATEYERGVRDAIAKLEFYAGAYRNYGAPSGGELAAVLNDVRKEVTALIPASTEAICKKCKEPSPASAEGDEG